MNHIPELPYFIITALQSFLSAHKYYPGGIMSTRRFDSAKCFVIFFSVFLLSFFSCSNDKLVTSDGVVNWNRYYSTDETNEIMRQFSDLYPDLTNMYSIGKSYQRADLYVMEVTNFNTGLPSDKPAIYIDGNLHSGELTGSAVTMYMMGYLLNNYGTDDRVTKLLDTRTFYFRPKFNPDGSDLALFKNVSLRSSVKPFDNDRDGTADEDPPDDLDGDGVTTQMRFPDPDGRWKMHPSDPRIMIRREPDETGGPFYSVVSEGIDNDGDGRLNEDGTGGLDLNRNFPRNWEPQYLQSGAGAFPLSEPETYAALKFLDEKKNVCLIVHNHTAGGFVFRLPSTADPSTFPPDDLSLIIELSDSYTDLTGRVVRRSYTSPETHRYGTLISWGYWDRGIIGWVPEYWPGFDNDLDGDGNTDQVETLNYLSDNLDGRYFTQWTPYEHPEFGLVEIGGFHRMYVRQNSPPELLEAECALQVPWMLHLSEQTPLLEMSEPAVTHVSGDTYEVSVTVTNTGVMPTNLTDRAIIAELIYPVSAEIMLIGAELSDGRPRIELGHLAGSRPVSGDPRPQQATARWTVKKSAANATFSIQAVSEKGGTVRSGRIVIK